MTPAEIDKILAEFFGADVREIAPNSWQAETPDVRVLVLLSDDLSWLRILVPIVPEQEAEPLLKQLMEANFDATGETRYALHQGVLWGVFQYNSTHLAAEDLKAAIAQLVSLRKRGVSDSFNQLIENRIRQIIQVAKLQGQSLEATLQTLDRFYEEGIMGDMEQGAGSREEVLAAWRYQLERLWHEV